MSYEFFIAKRLIKTKQSKFSRPIVIVATVSIALGITVMLLSVFVLTGFKSGIREKIAGFGGHLQIISYNVNNTYLSNPITLSFEEAEKIKNIPNVASINPFITKGGAIKTKNDFMGVVLKGIDNSYDTNFFAQNLIDGKLLNTNKPTNDILISKYITDKMNLNIGDKIRIFFYIDETYRQRTFTISGIYETGLGIYDEKMLICDMRVLQAINLWQKNEYEGYEINLKNFDKLSATAENIYYSLSQDKTIRTIQEIEPSLFAWLDLLDSNVAVILIVMILVSIVVITSTLLIMIFEKSTIIGILKGFGATTLSIMKIFLYKAVYVILKGLIYGNLLALTLGFLQNEYRLFSLNPQSYYLDHVPVKITFWWILLVNLLAIVVCTIALLVPAHSIAKISPINSIKNE
ncbi:MAG: ABC transporter permease [Bacteroidales bacterium]|jgi:lipoprotein-releasing system permease protein|nr:ABC transporter permease [Bacteroidales bacterium]